jgi:hypothetical protein
MEIKKYHDDGTYVVEYRPKDNTTYQNIELGIGISLEDTEAHTEEHILARLAGCSPQHFWRQQELSKTFDATLRKSIVGTIHDDAHNLLPEPVADTPAPRMVPRIDVPIIEV